MFLCRYKCFNKVLQDGYYCLILFSHNTYPNLKQITTSFFKNLGDLERLRRFWLTGTCNPYKEEKKASEPLAPEQFLSAFLLLLCGIFIATGLMGMEHGYMKWMRGTVHKARDTPGCMAMISLVRFIY